MDHHSYYGYTQGTEGSHIPSVGGDEAESTGLRGRKTVPCCHLQLGELEIQVESGGPATPGDPKTTKTA